MISQSKAMRKSVRKPDRGRVAENPRFHLSTHKKDSIEHIRELVQKARRLIESVPIAADVPRIRDELIEILETAVKEANALAKASKIVAEKGSGGIPPKLQWYRVIGYLAHVLDGVCKNVQLNELNRRLDDLEKELDATEPTTNDRGYTP